MAGAKDFLSLTDDLICILDESGRIMEVNENWKKHFQVNLSENVELLEFIKEENTKETFRKFLDDHRIKSVKISSCKLRASICDLWVDLKVKRVPSENRYWCLIKDISSTKHAHMVLDQISEVCNLGHYQYNSRDDSLIWSPKVYQIFKALPHHSQPTLQSFRSFFTMEDLCEFDNNQKSSFDFTFKVKVENESKWIRLTGRRDFHEDGTYFSYGIVQDVSLDVLKEKSQLSSNIELSSYEKGLDQFSIVARTDAQGKIIQANEEFCRISKYSYEELLGKDHRIVNSGHHPKAFFQEMWQTIKAGRNWRGEIKNKAKDGTYYWVDTIIIPLRNSNEELIEILSFRFDITSLKEIQEQNMVLSNKLSLLQMANSIPLWSLDILNNKMEWNSSMRDLFKLNETPDFEKFLSFMEDEDKRLIKIRLEDPEQTEFSRIINFRSKELMVNFKILRNTQGKAIRLDGTCSQIHSSREGTTKSLELRV